MNIRLETNYKEKIVSVLTNEFKFKNRFQVPRLEKIVLSMGLGRAIQDKKILETAVEVMTLISGQKPVVCAAKKSVSNFKLRDGMDIGAKVTLRRRMMYEFLDRLINLAIPRVRDFRGLSPKGFDGRGNYNLGLSEVVVFPEVNPDKVPFQLGLNVTMVTSARNDQEGRQLLKLFGMPFQDAQEQETN
jgi:large subunit ribosomal protein L5